MTLVRLDDRNQKLIKTKTDAQGWWACNNVPPGNYLRHYGRLYAGQLFYQKSDTRSVEPGKVANLGTAYWRKCPEHKGW